MTPAQTLEYSAFGLCIRSELSLAGLDVPEEESCRNADVTIVNGTVPENLDG